MALAGRVIPLVLGMMGLIGMMGYCEVDAKKPARILLDTDVGSDDLSALIYVLKQNRSEFDLKVWSVRFVASSVSKIDTFWK